MTDSKLADKVNELLSQSAEIPRIENDCRAHNHALCVLQEKEHAAEECCENARIAYENAKKESERASTNVHKQEQLYSKCAQRYSNMRKLINSIAAHEQFIELINQHDRNALIICSLAASIYINDEPYTGAILMEICERLGVIQEKLLKLVSAPVDAAVVTAATSAVNTVIPVDSAACPTISSTSLPISVANPVKNTLCECNQPDEQLVTLLAAHLLNMRTDRFIAFNVNSKSFAYIRGGIVYLYAERCQVIHNPKPLTSRDVPKQFKGYVNNDRYSWFSQPVTCIHLPTLCTSIFLCCPHVLYFISQRATSSVYQNDSKVAAYNMDGTVYAFATDTAGGFRRYASEYTPGGRDLLLHIINGTTPDTNKHLGPA